MGVIALVIGLFAFLFMCIGLIPFLGWFNWLNLPLAVVGLVVGAIGLRGRRTQAAALGGVIFCGSALVIGVFRLIVGAGLI
jgi:hypothetical protein